MKKIYFLLLALGLFTGVEAQIINFPDANFKAKLLAASPTNQIAKNLVGTYFKIDADNDGEIQVNEALNVSFLNLTNASIINLQGISNFINLKTLNCFDNQISTLDVSSLSQLISLNCSYNILTSLNLSGLTSLEILFCQSSSLTSLDISQNLNLKVISCGENQISNLNVTGLIHLEELSCNNNLLTNLDVTANVNLKQLVCSFNQINSLNVVQNTNLQSLYCGHNQIVTIDLSQNTSLFAMHCEYNLLSDLQFNNHPNLADIVCVGNQLLNFSITNSPNLQILEIGYNNLTSLDVSCAINELNFVECIHNQLQTLIIKNGHNDSYNVLFSDNPNLSYVCADESEFGYIQSQLNQFGNVNCHVNSYCSFTPGGEYYTVQGTNKYDANNNNDCDASDLSLPNLKFNITDGTNAGSIVSNASGSYSIAVQAGTHTITPVLENSNYFAISPATLNVNFPTQTSPFTQNFCITANGVHPDLEVSVLPITAARPGFDAEYKIIYKNKGNTTQSGTVNLAFNDTVLDLVVSNPVVTIQTANNLSWDFTNLLPFETREITLTLNVNSPMETPAVNGGDVLNYTTAITSAATDDLPNDNTFAFPQTVVNSLDPNDKTCLEGTKIAPEKVGEYVHYLIRFENSGTFAAENIVVKDMIDAAKFDIATLVPMKGSHPFVTNITSGNKVEFIFENINLPFDDANNDGYVAFKIKTLPTLVNGDTFSNTASIYFDYNFPIVTNTATTTIEQVLNVQDFEFSNYLSLYPNPVSNILNISAKESIEISSINIYNTLGQLVLVIPKAKDIKTVDVSSLTSGNYFIKIHSDKGTSNTKFIKN